VTSLSPPVYEQYDSGSAVVYWLDRWTRYQKVPGSILTMYMYTAYVSLSSGKPSLSPSSMIW